MDNDQTQLPANQTEQLEQGLKEEKQSTEKTKRVYQEIKVIKPQGELKRVYQEIKVIKPQGELKRVPLKIKVVKPES